MGEGGGGEERDLPKKSARGLGQSLNLVKSPFISLFDISNCKKKKEEEGP